MDQARYIYRKVEQEGIVNVETLKQEIEDDRINKENIDDEDEVNPPLSSRILYKIFIGQYQILV